MLAKQAHSGLRDYEFVGGVDAELRERRGVSCFAGVMNIEHRCALIEGSSSSIGAG